MEKKDIYDKRQIFEEKIDPLVQKLKMECNLNHMPMLITVAVANDEAGTTYNSDMIYSSANVRLTEKKIGRLLLLINDFEVTPPLHIQSCIRDLEDYLDKLQVAAKKGEIDKVALTVDKIQDMNGVMAVDDRVEPPKELVEKLISDDFYADME